MCLCLPNAIKSVGIYTEIFSFKGLSKFQVIRPSQLFLHVVLTPHSINAFHFTFTLKSSCQLCFLLSL